MQSGRPRPSTQDASEGESSKALTKYGPKWRWRHWPKMYLGQGIDPRCLSSSPRSRHWPNMSLKLT
jgi:hypothetical protein